MFFLIWQLLRRCRDVWSSGRLQENVDFSFRDRVQTAACHCLWQRWLWIMNLVHPGKMFWGRWIHDTIGRHGMSVRHEAVGRGLKLQTSPSCCCSSWKKTQKFQPSTWFNPLTPEMQNWKNKSFLTYHQFVIIFPYQLVMQQNPLEFRCLKQLESYSRQNKVNTNAEVPVTFMDRSIWGWSGCLMNLKFIFNLCKTSAAAWTLFPHLISCSKKLKMWSRFSLKDSWEFCFAGFNMIL